jgi:hypothetical protein
MELARRDITGQSALAPVKSIPGVSLGDERHLPWLGLTTVLGAMFLAEQLLVWNRLGTRGFHLGTDPGSSFVYFLTGMHGLHLAGGALSLTSLPMSPPYSTALSNRAASSSTSPRGTGIS